MSSTFAPKTRKQFESELEEISRQMEFEMVDNEEEHVRRRNVRALLQLNHITLGGCKSQGETAVGQRK